jgi:hypothetical protein
MIARRAVIEISTILIAIEARENARGALDEQSRSVGPERMLFSSPLA